MITQRLSFLTPYWSGSEMMRIHLESIRRFHPDAPVLVSKRGGGQDEMDAYAREFRIQYWLEEYGFTDAYLNLLQRCESEYVCIMDHDALLLSGLDPYLDALSAGRYDLVGIEERIRVPDAIWKRYWPEDDGWLRFAPGCVAANFLLFNWRAFKEKWGLRGIWGKRPAGTKNFEFDYGIGQRLTRHHFLQPYHAPRYGMGNLLKDGHAPILWHQWYGSYRGRLDGRLRATTGTAAPGDSVVATVVESGERAYLADYPDLDFSVLTPAWGPDRDIDAERRAFADASRFRLAAAMKGLLQRAQSWRSRGVRGTAKRARARLDRWLRLR